MKTDAAGTLEGSFQLAFTNHNVTQVTDPIAVNAVALIAHENTSSIEAGVGLGESMQAKLQALGNNGQVFVNRSPPDARGGYSWTITFMSEPGNLQQMEVASSNITSPESQITIRTTIQGASTIWCVKPWCSHYHVHNNPAHFLFCFCLFVLLVFVVVLGLVMMVLRFLFRVV